MAPTTRSKRKRQEAAMEAELLHCAAYDDLDRVRQLVELDRVSVKCTNEYGSTPLMITAWQGISQVARLLLENDANVDAANNNGWTALVWAVYYGNVAVAEVLLEYGANVNKQFCLQVRTYSYLGYAIVYKRVEMVRLLLRFGANTEETLYKGKTYSALYWACSFSILEIVQLLLSHGDGVDVNFIKPRSGDSPAMTPLCQACLRGHLEMAQLLIQHGARVIFDGVYPTSPSPLAYAAENISLDLARFLLDNSRFSVVIHQNARLPEMGEANHPLSPALESALCRRKLDLAQLLVDRGANVNDRPFLYKCANIMFGNYVGAVRLLLRAGANVNQADRESGATPLWAAAKNGHDELVNELLKARADVRIPDNNGETPLGVAFRRGHKGIVYLLLRTSPHVWSKLVDVVCKG